MPAQPKLQRWIDLLAALLRRKFPADFETLRQEVPAYAEAGRKHETLMRMFERDKDELRALGVPIETSLDGDGSLSQYRLASRQFYLPFLQLAYDTPRPVQRPRGPGYQGLPVLAFEPEELDAIARAAHRVAALGDAALAHEAMRALRKLGHDLPIPREAPTEELVSLEQPPDPDLLERLGNALQRRKRVTFTYRSMHRDAESERTVEPFGLAFLSGHWYLIARDAGADSLRHFRVSRIRDIAVNEAKSQSPDFVIPADFDLAQHARSRQAWELGDAELVEVSVRFRVQNGFTLPAMQLGDAVPEDATLRRFRVRRPDTFALWILGFAGDARIEHPSAMVEQVRALARETLAKVEA
jgi:proteasome accessory factor B